MEIPDKNINIYPKTKKNIKHLLNFYFDEFEPDKNGSVEYLMSKTSLSLNQIEFIVKKLHENFLIVKSLFNNQNQLKLFLKYAIEAATQPEDTWEGSHNTKRILLLIKNKFEKIESKYSDDNCNITPLVDEDENYNVTPLVNEDKNEVIKMTLFDFQNKFDINFSILGTDFYLQANFKNEYETIFWEYMLDDSVRFYDHNSRKFISLTIPLLKEILGSFQPNKEIELLIEKKMSSFNYLQYNIIGFNIINEIYRPEEDGFDYDNETNEEWISNNFDEDDIDTVLGNLD